jgi:hypothetical protein
VKYLMIVCYDPTVDPADAEGGMDIDAWVAEMDGRGVRLEGRALEPSDATTVRVRRGETLISEPTEHRSSAATLISRWCHSIAGSGSRSWRAGRCWCCRPPRRS